MARKITLSILTLFVCGLIVVSLVAIVAAVMFIHL